MKLGSVYWVGILFQL